MSAGKWLMAASALILAAGCMTGPDYASPDVKTPAKWSEPMQAGETDAAPPSQQWWASFGDPLLDTLIARAAAGNFDLHIAAARVREARAVQDIAGAALWPQVDTSAAYQRVQTQRIESAAAAGKPSASMTLSQKGLSITGLPSGAAGPAVTVVPDLTGGGNTSVTVNSGAGGGAGVPKRQADVFQAGFDARWELDVFGGLRRGREAARADTEALEEQRRAVAVMVAAEVARNYFELRSAQNRLETAHNNITAQEEALAIARARFEAGLTSELDAKTAEAQLAASRSVIPSLETAAQFAIHRLGVLAGSDPGALQQELAPAKPLPPTPPEVPVGLPADIIRRRPDIRAAERAVAAATARVGVARADLYPRFALVGSLTGRSGTLEGLTRGANRLWSIGPSIQWPIFDAGRIRANIRVQNARLDQALTAYERSVMTALEEVENTLVAYAKEQNRLVALTEAVDANQRALTIARELYQRGLVGFINVLDAERNLFSTQDQQTQSRAAVLANLVAVYKSVAGPPEPKP